MILTVAGLPITSRQAGEHLGQIESGVLVGLKVRRGDRIVSIRIIPRESTEKRPQW
ncbi:MAG TPA: hypothetical protein VGA22_07780 [Gemmatimonadales bacterium]